MEFANFVLLFFKGDLLQALKMTKLSVAFLGIIFSLFMPYLAEASDKLSIAKKAAASQATQESRSRGKSDNYEDLRNVFRFVGKKFGIKASKNKDLYEEAFVLGRQYASHYQGVGLQRVVDQLVGGPQGLKSPEEQSKDDKERNVDNLIMGLQVLDYAQVQVQTVLLLRNPILTIDCVSV